MTISIIGTGNVATNLIFSLHSRNISVDYIYARTQTTENKSIAKQVGATLVTEMQLNSPLSDLYIIATTDSAIEEIAASLSNKQAFMVHTAGSVGIDVFKEYSNNYGVFYPFQTFRKEKPVDFTDIPICLEANTPENLEKLFLLAKKLSNNIHFMSSNQRKHLHLSGVFVSNFTNHMVHIAYKLLENNNIDTQLMQPLIQETFQKLEKMHPAQAQTGPALRNDTNVLNLHLELLKNTPNLEKIYRFVSNSIDEFSTSKINV